MLFTKDHDTSCIKATTFLVKSSGGPHVSLFLINMLIVSNVTGQAGRVAYIIDSPN